jgi:hypothetical protein
MAAVHDNVYTVQPPLKKFLIGIEFKCARLRNDLAGVDRPDLVDALAREIYGGAELTPPR